METEEIEMSEAISNLFEEQKRVEIQGGN